VHYDSIKDKTHILDLLVSYADLTSNMFEPDNISQQIHDRIASYADKFLEWLENETGKRRLCVIELLGYLSSNVNDVSPRLLEEWKKTISQQERAEILTALAFQKRNETDMTDELSDDISDLLKVTVRDNSSWLLRYRAWIGLIMVYEDSLDDELMDLISEIVPEAEKDLKMWGLERNQLSV